MCCLGIRTELEWAVLVLLVASTEVTQWYSFGRWAELDNPGWCHSSGTVLGVAGNRIICDHQPEGLQGISSMAVSE